MDNSCNIKVEWVNDALEASGSHVAVIFSFQKPLSSAPTTTKKSGKEKQIGCSLCWYTNIHLADNATEIGILQYSHVNCYLFGNTPNTLTFYTGILACKQNMTVGGY